MSFLSVHFPLNESCYLFYYYYYYYYYYCYLFIYLFIYLFVYLFIYLFGPHLHLPHIISVFSVELCCASVSVYLPIRAGFISGPAVLINRVQLSIYLRGKKIFQSSISLTLLTLSTLSVAWCDVYLMSLVAVFSFVALYLFCFLMCSSAVAVDGLMQLYQHNYN